MTSEPFLDFYTNHYHEHKRLASGRSQLEYARTLEIVNRYLQPEHAVADIGCGAGTYALWLARQGHKVSLLDPVERHIEQAREAFASNHLPLEHAVVGDARALPWEDHSVDVALMLGPLYHLTEREDRLTALREAFRIVKPGGFVFAAAISRYTSVLDGFWRGYMNDPTFAAIARQDLIDGQHRNETQHPSYFTTAFFHRPEELQSEVEEAGFTPDALLGIEGPGWLIPDFASQWQDETKRASILHWMRALEAVPSLLGVSAHLMAIGGKPV